MIAKASFPPTQLFIGGRWVDGPNKVTVTDKFTGEIAWELSGAGPDEVHAAVAAAKAAFPIMARMPIWRRAEILNKTSQLLAENRAGIANCIAREVGKAIKYAGFEVDRAVDTFRLAAEEAAQIHGETIPMDAVKSGEGLFGFWHRKPLGVVGAITPFNFPLNLAAHKIAPALAAGNTIVLKPAEATSRTGAWIVALLEQAGLPAGCINLVHGKGSVLGDLIVKHPDIAKITFTGSLEVGLGILANAGLKKVTLELGNSSPVVIAADADMKYAAAKAAIGANYCSGQVCISTQRIYIEAAGYDAFKKHFLEEVAGLKVGDPLDPETDVGPLILEKDAIRVESWIHEAVAEGATLLAGGTRVKNLLQPSVLENTKPTMKVIAQEVFGPAVSLIKVDTFEEGLKLADDTQYGLQAAVFTRDIERVFQAIHGLNFGGVVVNDCPHLRPDQIPYGGNRQSGLGREGLRFAIEEMTSIQTVMFRTGHAR
jgi:acyl-CoA reductase-like NAD-dependent aldehyde dehydrogenase